MFIKPGMLIYPQKRMQKIIWVNADRKKSPRVYFWLDNRFVIDAYW